MPEGPSIMIVKDEFAFLKGKEEITEASGYAELDYDQLINKKITSIKTWGKHLFICLAKTNIEIHFMLFGSYLVNDTKPKINAKLHLGIGKDEVNFYVVSAKLTPSLKDFDASGDIMDEDWDPKQAKAKLKEIPDTLICDALMDQHIFSGVGNIIKNEVMWRAKVYPGAKVSELSAGSITKIAKEVSTYAWEFYEQKPKGTLSKNWKAYNQETCSRCGAKMIKKKMGKTKRASFYCSKEQAPQSTKNSTTKITSDAKTKKNSSKKR